MSNFTFNESWLADWKYEDSREEIVKGIQSENNPKNLYEFLDDSFWYLHKERTKYEFGSNEKECKPISKGLLHCCKLISEKMLEHADVEYTHLADKIRDCLNECAYYIPRDSQEFQSVNQNIDRYFSNLVDHNFKNPGTMIQIGRLISRQENSDMFEKYVNRVFEQYSEQPDIRKNLLSVFDDRYIFNQENKFENNPYVSELMTQRLENKDIASIDSISTFINSPRAVKSLLQLSEEKAKNLDETHSFGIIENCSKIIEKYPEDKEIAQSISDVLFLIPQTPDVMEEMSSICKAISKSYPDIKVPSKASYRKKLAQETKNLFEQGNLEEAIDNFAYIGSSQAYKRADEEQINRVIKKMPNGCVAVGFLCEQRGWDRATPGWGGSSGIEWKWYSNGFIIDPNKMKIVGQCKTETVTVRDKYSASRDIYQNINMDKIMKVEGNKLFVCVGGYALATTEYDPKKEAQIEGSLARIKKNKKALAEKDLPITEQASTHSNSSNTSGANGRDDGGR